MIINGPNSDFRRSQNPYSITTAQEVALPYIPSSWLGPRPGLGRLGDQVNQLVNQGPDPNFSLTDFFQPLTDVLPRFDTVEGWVVMAVGALILWNILGPSNRRRRSELKKAKSSFLEAKSEYKKKRKKIKSDYGFFGV